MQLTRLVAPPFPVGPQASGPRLIVVPATFEGALPDGTPTPVIDAVTQAKARGTFRGKSGDKLSLTGLFDGIEVLVVGVGKAEEVDSEACRTFAGRAVRAAERIRQSSLAVCVPGVGSGDAATRTRAVAEGLVLASWVFRDLKTEGQDEAAPEVTSAGVWTGSDDPAMDGPIQMGLAVGRGENLTRTLQILPGNHMTPTLLAQQAEQMAAAVGVECEVWGPERLEAERMHALLSVAQGSDEEPRFIILRYNGGTEGDAPVALVGKGLTFDAGGYSLKPPKGMEEMKYDMSGGAAVIGAVQAIAEAKLPINVLGVVPSSENLINGSATKPGDVISSRAGKTIEVINTDAEGRLILADALAWTAEQEPAAMIDCATLTGSVIIALGHRATAVMSPDEELAAEIREAGEESGQRCWPLPLWDVYRKQLDSEVADLQNVGGRPAGSITAGRFLQEFAGEVRWAHLDIAGTAWGTEPESYQRKGPTGVPTRLFFEWVRSRSE